MNNIFQNREGSSWERIIELHAEHFNSQKYPPKIATEKVIGLLFRSSFLPYSSFQDLLKLHFQSFLNNDKEENFSLKWKLLFTYALKELRNKGSNIARLEIKLSHLAMLKEKRSTFIIPPIKSFSSHLIKLQIKKDLCRRGKIIPVDLLSLWKVFSSGQGKKFSEQSSQLQDHKQGKIWVRLKC